MRPTRLEQMAERTPDMLSGSPGGMLEHNRVTAIWHDA